MGIIGERVWLGGWEYVEGSVMEGVEEEWCSLGVSFGVTCYVP